MFAISLSSCSRYYKANFKLDQLVFAIRDSPLYFEIIEDELQIRLDFANATDRYQTRSVTPRPVSLLCVLAWEKRPKFFTCHDAILECTRHFVPMFVPMKNFRVHSRMASYDGVFSRQHVKFRTKHCLSDISGLVSILC